MIRRDQFEVWIPFPLERVFLFFANPKNLPRIMPSASGTRIDALRLVEPSPSPSLAETDLLRTLAGVGSEIVTSFRTLPPLPFRAQWVARVTEFEWKRYFADIQVTGPFKRWHHRHEFEAEMRDGINGTVVRDRIEYEIGFGVLGTLAQKLFVGLQMARTFAHRQRILEELLRAEDRNAA